MCVGCRAVWPINYEISPVAKQQHTSCPITNFAQGDVSLPACGVHVMWARDPRQTLTAPDHIRRLQLLNLSYQERESDEMGYAKDQRVGLGIDNVVTSPSASGSVHPASVVNEPTRSALVAHLLATLNGQTQLLRSAAEVAVELRPEERDAVRRALVELGRVVRIDLGDDGRRETPGMQGVGTPKIEVESAERSFFSAGTMPMAVERRPSRLVIPTPTGGAGIAGEELNPSSPRTPDPSFCPGAILKHGNNEQTNTTVDTTVTTTTTTSTTHVDNTTTTMSDPSIQDDGLPKNIPPASQATYYNQMLLHCLSATTSWATRHKSLLLSKCECSVPSTPTVSSGPFRPPTRKPTGRLGGGPQQQQQPLPLPTPTHSASSSSTGSHPTRRPPNQDCFLHKALASPHKVTLPQWTHALRRYHDAQRIPPQLLANPKSFCGEIQPVDEVYHSAKSKKIKNDRELLALVMVARQYCFQLKDLERCGELDALYGVIEEGVALEKRGRMGEMDTPVTVVGEKKEGGEEWSTVERKKRWSKAKSGVLARGIGHSSTWPRAGDC